MPRAIETTATSLVLAMLLAAGCNCGETSSTNQQEPARAGAAPAEKDEAGPKRKRPNFNIARTGSITATVAGAPVEFGVLPPEKNRMMVLPKTSVVLIEGRPSAESTESIVLRLQGYDIKASVGRGNALVPRRNEKVAVAIVTYVDPEGTEYYGAARINGEVTIGIDNWESKTEALTGTFSGTLYTKDKSKSVVVENGRFSTQRAAT